MLNDNKDDNIEVAILKKETKEIIFEGKSIDNKIQKDK